MSTGENAFANVRQKVFQWQRWKGFQTSIAFAEAIILLQIQGNIITRSTHSTNVDDFTEVFRANCHAGCLAADRVCLIKTGIEGGQSIQCNKDFLMFLIKKK